jgi:LysR family nod box-dependent transcriptional activator
MRFKNLDLNLLVALDALLTEQHVTRAAERVALTQSAMSGALARLREHFGDELIVKSGHGHKLALTPLGFILRKSVRDILLQTQSVMNTRPDFDPARSNRHFSIVASDFVDTVLMPDVSKTLASTAPDVVLELLHPLGRNIPIDLDRGEVDLLIVPLQYASQVHPTEILFQDRMSCVVWNDNSIVGDQLSVEGYLELQHVAMNFGRARMQSFEGEFLESSGFHRKVSTWVSSFVVLPQMVVGTNRIATVPYRLAEYYAKSLPIRVLAPPLEFPEVCEVVQWNAYQDNDPAILWLRRMLKEGAAGLKSLAVEPALVDNEGAAGGREKPNSGRHLRRTESEPASH